MQESNALRPELKGLFETIKEQAIKYNDAFNDLSKYSQTYQTQLKSIADFFEIIQVQFKNEIENFHNQTEKDLEVIKIETHKTLEKYSELSDLKNIQEEYQNTLQKIEKIKDEYLEMLETQVALIQDGEKHLIDFRKKADDEINLIINDSHSIMVTAASNEAHKVDEKLTIKIKQLETRIYKAESIILDFNSKYDRDFKNVNNDFETLKQAFASIGQFAEDHINKLQEQYDQTVAKQSSRLSLIQESMGILEDKIKNVILLNELEDIKADTPMEAAPVVNVKQGSAKNAFNKLKEEQSKLNSQVEHISNKNTLTLVASVFAVLLSLITLAFMILR